MVYMDKVRSHIVSQLTLNIILCVEASTKIFKNCCRGGHQRVGKGLTILEWKDIVIECTVLLPNLQ